MEPLVMTATRKTAIHAMMTLSWTATENWTLTWTTAPATARTTTTRTSEKRKKATMMTMMMTTDSRYTPVLYLLSLLLHELLE